MSRGREAGQAETMVAFNEAPFRKSAPTQAATEREAGQGLECATFG